MVEAWLRHVHKKAGSVQHRRRRLRAPTDCFAGADATVLDYWRWAFSDLRDNTQRGVLAEFLVALALGRTETRRKAWDNYDVTTSSGLRIEVKASGYLQS
jgi:hypothetical protein